ncbi:MAG: hypothetical protein IT371_14460 [Deltaproteobacteria bacterium]|nr:hypothetical protein [Deltaproteobacteria bacterium]
MRPRRLVLFSLLALGAGSSASARQIAVRSAEEVLASAQVVAIARVVKVTEKDSKCDHLTELVLRPEQSVRGQLPPWVKEVQQSIGEHKSAPGCISVSETVPPRARTRTVGAKVIITIEFVAGLKAHRAIASFELAELEKIKGIVRRLSTARSADAPAEVAPAKDEELRWVEETLEQMERNQDFQLLVARFGTAPRKNGSYTEVTPRSPSFASVLLLDQRHEGGARTQRVTVVFARGRLPAVGAFEARFGRAKKTPPMADREGRSVTWTKIIYVGTPRLKRGQGRIVLRLEGGPSSSRVAEVTVDDYLGK